MQEPVSEANGFETHKVAAAVVQEPVSEPNGFETHKVAAAVVQEPVSWNLLVLRPIKKQRRLCKNLYLNLLVLRPMK